MANQDYQKTKYELFKSYKKPTSDQVAFMQLYGKHPTIPSITYLENAR